MEQKSSVEKNRENEIGIVFPCGVLKISPEERLDRLQTFKTHHLKTRIFEPETESDDGYSAGHTLERAMYLAQALTLRKYPILWVGKGGYGSTTIIEALDMLLPPVLPDKTLFGYSDASFIGHFLALKYPNFTYIMGGNAFERNFFNRSNPHSNLDLDLSLSLLKGMTPDPVQIEVTDARFPSSCPSQIHEVSGILTPINLSLAESLVCLQGLRLPRGRILFIEDINEDLFRILRKVDSLLNSGFLQHTEAIVLGEFDQCADANQVEISLPDLARIIAARTDLPTFVVPVFGHGTRRMPLVCGSRVEFRKEGTWKLRLGFERTSLKKTSILPVERELFAPRFMDKERVKVHLLGIGGTGMTAVAGLAKKAGFKVTGSDGPIYPPMSDVLRELEITPFTSYHASNLTDAAPDLVILANAISRIDGSLKRNDELESLMRSHLPTMSFPGFMRQFLLKKTLNIVVAGTHGKTTTSSAIAFALRELDHDPSFLIGGAPKNFDQGFYLGKKKAFVLEGDEYDTALFDKGPKFLSYEPRISIINNIEFDHADIYDDLEAIKSEFERLAHLTAAKKGILVANTDDACVLDVLARANFPTFPTIGFGTFENKSSGHIPKWQYLSHSTRDDGSDVFLMAPSGEKFTIRSLLFGKHNALNLVATLAAVQAFHLLKERNEGYSAEKLLIAASESTPSAIERWCQALSGFAGVKRRFELLLHNEEFAIFDDFAHHPTAIKETLSAFREYHQVNQRTGSLKVCFDPRNATMRRNILQNDLTQSLRGGDKIYLGRVAQDLRIPEEARLNSKEIVRDLGKFGCTAEAFESNEKLLETVSRELGSGDTLVFMSSGSFDQVPRTLVNQLKAQKNVGDQIKQGNLS